MTDNYVSPTSAANVKVGVRTSTNVRVGGNDRPVVTAVGNARKLKDSTDLAFVDVSDGDVIVYQSNTNSFIMESIGEAIHSLSLIGNVDTTTLVNGAVLIYKASTQKWVSTTTLEAQNLEGGHY